MPMLGRQSERDEDRISEDDPKDDRAIYEVNMLSKSIGSSLEVFGEVSLFAFKDWAERFKDYLSVSGKIDTPRALFKELQPGQIRTVDDALNALKNLEVVKAQAQELEALLLANKGMRFLVSRRW
ncbi:hypothetical protein GPALN_012333 [Globodera pallida]|nr:hypothetical protein GPALN_012333 [Globodera pallida]